MLTANDLNPHDFPLTSNQENNLDILASLLTALEDEFRKSPGGFLFTITSGFRSLSDHYRIYKLKGIDHPPMGSAHLTGEACDVSDPLGVLKTWCGTEDAPNPHLVRLGLYCEAGTIKWMHFQSRKPHSGHRFFQP